MRTPDHVILLPCFLVILHLVCSMPVSGDVIYESDWFEMDLDSYAVLTHGLGGDPGDYLVFLYGKNFYGRHQVNYGIVEKDLRWFGVEWLELNPNTVTLYRCEHDDQAGEAKWWEFIKIIIIRADCISADCPCGCEDIGFWSQDGSLRTNIPVLDFYDSEWFTINPGDCLVKTHGLGGDPGEYLVFVHGRNGFGIHQARYGMAEASGSWIGLNWLELNSSTITIRRAPDDDISGQFGPWDEARVRIIKTDVDQIDPHYDSGWFGIDPDEDVDLYHNLGGDPGRYMVFLYGKNPYGIHHTHYGTLEARVGLFSRWFGGEWYQLNEDRITVRRAADDDSYIEERDKWQQARVIIVGELWDPCSNVVESEDGEAAVLLTNSPNPFYGETEIRFYVTRETWVEVAVYDVAGRRIRTLLDEARGRGWQRADWDGRDADGRAVSSGHYFVQLSTPGQEVVRSLVLMR